MPRAAAIYYLHPLLAGMPDDWQAHFARCRKMGFDHVLLAPPFEPGAAGDIFLTRSHRHFNAALGGHEATDELFELAKAAKQEGIELLLDLVVDRVAADADLVRDHPDWVLTRDDDLPDPRHGADRAVAQLTLDERLAEGCWRSLMAEWIDAGIAGFRCDAAHRVPAPLWESLITAARQRRPDLLFFAWQLGANAAEAIALRDCGFDLAASSSWAWDFQADWLDDDARRAKEIGALTAMPEMPFGSRIADEMASRRALAFAAAYGEAWLMPMGFEFGARAPLRGSSGRPEDFAALAASPPFDLSPEVANANANHRGVAGFGIGATLSAPGEAAAVILRPAPPSANDLLILANARLDQASAIAVEPLRPRLGSVMGLDADLELPLGDVRVLPLVKVAPVILPRRGYRAAEAGMQSRRIAIEAVEPSVDNGRFAVKRRVGETVEVTADIFCDGHEVLAAVLLWRPADMADWQQATMRLVANDRWSAAFTPTRIGHYTFTVEAWVDQFGGFRAGLVKKQAAGVDIALDLREGCELVARAATRSGLPDLEALATALAAAEPSERFSLLASPATARLMAQADDRPFCTRHAVLPLDADRQAGDFASWYELFPRSQSGDPGRHGTFDDVIARLPAISAMGFDVLYFPPIHPIGKTHRKGRNNRLRAEAGDPGSPYAIGGAEGGHEAIHPQLGTLEDFRRLTRRARDHGMEIALDFAIQCSPDHPWLRDHPDWFEWRPDGSLRYAENPPKKYEDIVNVAFYAEAALPELWVALRNVVLFWVQEGVRIFRVDNPHTKPLPFWEWMIVDVRRRHPDVIFLSEAFTRPKMMYRLAKVGFSQSYTYFTWRNDAAEMRAYLTELNAAPVREFFRPHFFVNTPDINPEFLQRSGRAGFLIRAALATTLSGLWGMYSGFELCEATPVPGHEEYLDSEKYEIRAWDWQRPGNIIAEISALNRIRRANPALQTHLGVRFLPCSSDAVLSFAKATPDFSNVLVVAISFDPFNAVEADMEIEPAALGLAGPGGLRLKDLLHDDEFDAQTGWRHLRLDPSEPYRIWRARPVGQSPARQPAA